MGDLKSFSSCASPFVWRIFEVLHPVRKEGISISLTPIANEVLYHTFIFSSIYHLRSTLTFNQSNRSPLTEESSYDTEYVVVLSLSSVEKHLSGKIRHVGHTEAGSCGT